MFYNGFLMLVNCSRTLINTWHFANLISMNRSEPLSMLTVTKQESTQKPGPSPRGTSCLSNAFHPHGVQACPWLLCVSIPLMFYCILLHYAMSIRLTVSEVECNTAKWSICSSFVLLRLSTEMYCLGRMLELC